MVARTAENKSLHPGTRRAGTFNGKFTRRDEPTITALTLTVCTWIFFRHIPPGVCFGDGGGLQLAATTLGITHPPGYPILASLGFLFSRLPAAEPAYMVTVACSLSGVVALWLCIQIQKQLGVPTALACATSLILVLHPRFWTNLTAPEVYMPSLALEAAGLYALACYSHRQASRFLIAGLLLCGAAVVNRPPIAVMLPFVIVAVWLVGRRRKTNRHTAVTSILLVAGAVAVDAFFAGTYLWVRDTDQTPFNYIRQYNDEYQSLPELSDGPLAKARRIWWLASAEQFQNRFDWSPAGTRTRWRRILREVAPIGAWPLLVLTACGATLAGRRRPETCLLMFGMFGAAASFVAVYTVSDDAADILPILFSGTVFCGVALSTITREQSSRLVRRLTRTVVIALAVFPFVRAGHLPDSAGMADATRFVQAAALDSLPAKSLILSGWRTSTPLWYAQTVYGQGSDLTIVNAAPGHWERIIQNTWNRPIYSTDPPGKMVEHDAVRLGPLWRITYK